jgi:FAD binding domain
MLDWGPLEGVIEGEVALPGSPAYEASRRPFNAQFHEVAPAGIVSCATPQDISEAISFARRHELELAMRSGGHSFAGHSSASRIATKMRCRPSACSSNHRRRHSMLVGSTSKVTCDFRTQWL